MTAFLTIQVCAARAARRVDFCNIAGLFAEDEDPARDWQPHRGRRSPRLVTAVLLLVATAGAVLLIAGPQRLGSGTPTIGAARAASQPITAS